MRRKLLNRLRTFTSLPRVKRCGWTPRAGSVGLRAPAEAGGPAGFSGLSRCGSVWACPECAPKVGAERALEIGQVIRYVVDERGGTVLHATFTTSHHGGQTLTETWDAVQGAWGHAIKGRSYCEGIKAAHDGLGFCRGFESTWGRTNGWHPHLHVLIFLGERIDAAAATKITDRLYTAYLAGLRKRGFEASAEHGVKVDIATTRRDAEVVLGKYLTKIASEITRNDRKTASGSRFTPFDLLREGVESGEADLLDRWVEWEQASFGRQQLTWGGDVRKLARLADERTDQEIADDEIGDQDALLLPHDSWVQVRDQADELLAVTETSGVAGAVAWLDQHGVAWHAPPGPGAKPWESDPELGRQVLVRDARRVLHRPRWQSDARSWVIGVL